MTTKAMKSLLAALGREASHSLRRPAEPRAVMEEFCRAMSVRVERPIQLLFRAFPPEIPVSGMRLDCGDRSIIVVEEGTVPEAQLVILGHELWHEEQGSCGHHALGATVARALTGDRTPEALLRAARQVLASEEVPREVCHTVAARSACDDDHEVDAETFGLLFAREVRTWMKGRYARGPVSPATVEGRINLSLGNRGGRLL
ncbi:toxin [Streptomyces sp. NBC_00201]|uniref:toxin n=1 Tax=Streptomyces sp. NBC_00201 TaxID=2975679 RepID=UPI00224EFD9A|nr:toxin [Streptomyces sp. NBC_00201]MCX5245779.1 toxin [Streptomyces sp. NBC_00201]